MNWILHKYTQNWIILTFHLSPSFFYQNKPGFVFPNAIVNIVGFFVYIIGAILIPFGFFAIDSINEMAQQICAKSEIAPNNCPTGAVIVIYWEVVVIVGAGRKDIKNIFGKYIDEICTFQFFHGGLDRYCTPTTKRQEKNNSDQIIKPANNGHDFDSLRCVIRCAFPIKTFSRQLRIKCIWVKKNSK